jgi:hypothetical protein
LLLFDPAAMPADFERRFQHDIVGTLEGLEVEGAACWINTEGDGSFLLHAYVDEPVPAELLAHAAVTEVIDALRIPSGQLYFAGSEYAFREDDRFLRKHSHMGGSVTLRPGAYRLALFRTEFPRGFLEEMFRRQATPWELRLWNSMKALVPLAIAAWIGLVVIFFTNVRVPFPGYLTPVLALVFSLPFVVRLSETYRSVKARYASLTREYPSLVARLDFLRADSR